MGYRKIKPINDYYKFVLEAVKQGKIGYCDAVTHNNPKGCNNPKCFKYVKKRKN